MLKEYAVQPELLSSWPAFRYLSDKLGYGRGRVIAEYPKKWRKMVYESLGDCMPMERKRIEAGLIKLRSALYPRPFDKWDKDKVWLDNAIEEHAKRPFSAIIAQDNPHGVVDVIREADLDEEVEPWKAERQRRIERTATEMVACAEMLLRNAKEILFVDPRFRPGEPRFKRSLQALLQIIAERPPDIPVRRIEIHTGHKTAGTKVFFDTECRRHLQPIIPCGMQIRLIRWDQNYLHNRFILTEYGGLQFATGLDDHNSSALTHDIVDLLEPEPDAQTWQEYQRDSPIFPLIEDALIIEGIA